MKSYPSAIRVKKDIVIPAGTILQNIDGQKIEFCSGNYSKIIGLTKDTSGEFIYAIDKDDPLLDEWFEELED